MTMKRLLITLILVAFSNICLFAQLQRRFFDFTLGVTTTAEVVDYFKKQGKEIEKREDNNYYVMYLEFGGNNWLGTSFSFYKDKLMSISFFNSELKSSRQSLEMSWERYQLVFSRKYSDYYDSKMSDDMMKVYNDDLTSVYLIYKESVGGKAMSLVYEDKKLSDEKREMNDNEL